MENTNLDLVRAYITDTYDYGDTRAVDATRVTLITELEMNGTMSVFLAKERYTIEATEGDYLITETGPDGQTAEIVRVQSGKVISVWANS